MAINATKQLLDELMGRERNLAPTEKKSSLDWNDPQVCRHFLVMFCPNSLFTNTRADIGPCALVHDDFLKKEYQQKAKKKEKMLFEDEFIRFCQQQLNEVERKIKRAKQRLEMSQIEKNSGLNAGNAILSEENFEKMKVLTEKIDTLLESVEQLGSEGKVEEAQGIMKLVDKLKDEKTAIRRESLPNNNWIQQKAEIGAQQEKQMEVCDVCGAFLIVNDVQQRVDDHLMGKQHMEYGRLKTALDEILERRRQERDREKAAEPDSTVGERKREERRRERSPIIRRERSRERERVTARRDSESVHHRSRDRDSRNRGSRDQRSERSDRSDRSDNKSSRHKHRSSTRRSRSRSAERSRNREHRSSKDKKSSKDSSKVLRKEGMTSFAFVTLVMKSDKYIAGALVLAKSLRDVSTDSTLICMVTNDISFGAIELLKKFYDFVKTVPYIRHKCIPLKNYRQQILYEDWIEESFTKWNCLNPQIYTRSFDKIIFVDADMLFTENCDDKLFGLEPPAMTFSSPWAQPYSYNGVHNPFGELKHGIKLGYGEVEQGFDSFVGSASLVLLRPDSLVFNQMLKLLDQNRVYGFTKCFSGFDEQLINQTFCSLKHTFSHIHQIYNWTVGKWKWLSVARISEPNIKPKVFHYYGDQKPWFSSRSFQWADADHWWLIADKIIARDDSTRKYFENAINVS